MKLFHDKEELPVLIFHIELKGRKTKEVRLAIRDQPIAHESKRVMKEIGNLVSEVRNGVGL